MWKKIMFIDRYNNFRCSEMSLGWGRSVCEEEEMDMRMALFVAVFGGFKL